MKGQKIMSVGKQIMKRRQRTQNTTTSEAEYQSYFYRHVDIGDDPNDCWLWTASKNNIGYGMFRHTNGMRTAHRLMAEWQGKDIKGKVVYHTCDNYSCVNPKHLQVGTIMDKAKIASDKGRLGTFWSDPKYHRKCNSCGTVASPAVIAHYHNKKCKH